MFEAEPKLINSASGNKVLELAEMSFFAFIFLMKFNWKCKNMFSCV